MKNMTDYFGRSLKGEDSQQCSKQNHVNTKLSTEGNSTKQSDIKPCSIAETNLGVKKGKNLLVNEEPKSKKKSLSKSHSKSHSHISVDPPQGPSENVNKQKNFSLRIKLKSLDSGCDDSVIATNHDTPDFEDDNSEYISKVRSPQNTMLRYLFRSPSPSETAAKPSTVIKDLLSDCQKSIKESDAKQNSYHSKTLNVAPELTVVHRKKFGKKKKSLIKMHQKSCRKKPSTSDSKRKWTGNEVDILITATDQDPDSMSEVQNVNCSVMSTCISKRKKILLSRSESHIPAEEIEESIVSVDKQNESSHKNSELPCVSKNVEGAIHASFSEMPKRDAGAAVERIKVKPLPSKRFKLLKVVPKLPSVQKIDSNQLSPESLPSHHVSKKRKVGVHLKEDCNKDCESSNRNFSQEPILLKDNFYGMRLGRNLREKSNELTDTSEVHYNGEGVFAEKEDAATGPKTDDFKKNSLMKYFSKMSKEDAWSKAEKVEVKVKAMIHSPPSTPSKNKKRRSMKSLPGGLTAHISNKEITSKRDQKDNIDAIELIDVIEIDALDVDSQGACQSVNISNSGSDILKLKINPATPVSNKIVRKESLDAPQLSPKNSSQPLCKRKSQNTKEVPCDKAFSSHPPDSQHLKNCEKQSNLPKPVRMCIAPVKVQTIQGDLYDQESENEENCLITQGKKRRAPRKRNSKSSGVFKDNSVNDKNSNYESMSEAQKSSPEIIFHEEIRALKEPSKIAPLFNRKATIEARQQFLQSGMPDQIKRMVETQHSFDDQACDLFPKDSHIQQIGSENVWNLKAVHLPLLPDNPLQSLQILGKVPFGEITEIANDKKNLAEILSMSMEGPRMRASRELPMTVIKPLLKQVRSLTPGFSVAKTFKALRAKHWEEQLLKAAANVFPPTTSRRKRKGASDRKSVDSKSAFSVASLHSQVWTEKYKPSTGSEIIGNKESVHQLKKWLEAWRQAGEELTKLSRKDDVKKGKRRKRRESNNSDDFVVSDDGSVSDDESGNLPVSAAILYGPSGCGKTCTVYALARDLGYKVLEVNASERRSGKIVLSKLSEATQSHQVQRSNNSAEQGFAALFSLQRSSSKKKKPKGEVIKSEEDKMCLILFEDVDIVFEEEDEGFLSAILSLISTSKRPVVLTATDPESSFLSRFINSSCITLELSPSRHLICAWLQIMSLLEGVYTAPSAVKSLVSLCGGDFRRALLQMQLWVTTGGNNLPMPALPMFQSRKSKKTRKKTHCFDEDVYSSFSSDDDSAINLDSLIPENPDCLGAMLGRNDVTQPESASDGDKLDTCAIAIPYPLNIGLYWWNIPRMLRLKQIVHMPPPPSKRILLSDKKKLLDDSFLEYFCSDEDSCLEAMKQDLDTSKACAEEVIAESNCSIEISPDVDCSHNKQQCSVKEMQAMTKLMLCVSSIDLIASNLNLPESDCNREPVTRLFQCLAKDGLSLTRVESAGPNCLLESTARDLCYWLAKNSIQETKINLFVKPVVPIGLSSCDFDPCLPSIEEKEWRVAHSATVDAMLAAVPSCLHLERQAISLDYIPAIRTMCRLEQERSFSNSKRKNRFYHYLRLLGGNLTEVQLETICQTFMFKDESLPH